ncbi:MAG: acetate--CoA ligase [Yaniella sp.]|uniref:acetate--CoA ligase n=1 Tax=Yaniella sp. TaxID=2773929 RepID=UPI00264907FA|nr:acetate--CoA ligase [Yaniella sp.]MDN5704168.1 acetate--CoA ligase [Yaniella sp.]MDN5816276.1 acetate--CoA ligase [Yaniella sp.]MDN5889572.1 acetate--CoA ligase [Yaniella sp.]MDN6172673.1 acetate--CoA ligase [Yaniella sp.]MDN6358486.1 acetate--CoA ligase [Yaniella sp.]
MTDNPTIQELSYEDRTFPPPPEFAAQANVQADEYDKAEADRLGFWAEKANRISWDTPFDEVLDWSDAPFAKWFTGGKLNAAYNCVDRHVEAGLGDRVAYYFEGEGGDTRTITYADLLREVSKAANALESLGVKTGDRVAIYMPMIPETVFAMLACARIGAPHTVIFGGFSDRAIADRVKDCGVEFIITADGGYRRGKANGLKSVVDSAIKDLPQVRNVLVVQRTKQEVAWDEGRDLWWHDVVDKQSDQHEPQSFDAEHPLYIMYSSGTTGKPKGIMHTTGGYLVGTSYTHWAVFDIKPETDVYWTAADIGWVTGHSYIVYGPLANATTSVLYEGTPDTPHRGRWWEIVEKYGVTILYCAPTSIRTFMKWGREIPAQHDLSSLRLLGSVGEPINPEAWMWYREIIGGDRCPIVDTWWQTENGSILISPLPGVTATKPGAAMRALPGVVADVYDEAGSPVKPGTGGYLVITQPWPAMLRTLWGDEERYKKTYWSQYPEVYFAGDGAKIDKDGDIWVLGRVDDVLNVSGHRMSTAEIESALVSHAMVAEAAVVGAQDETTGQAIEAFVILRESAEDDDNVIQQLREHVRSEIGPIATPRSIMTVPDLPKTRSGKIMRRLLKDVAENREIGDVTTLADASVMDLIQQRVRERTGN